MTRSFNVLKTLFGLILLVGLSACNATKSLTHSCPHGPEMNHSGRWYCELHDEQLRNMDLRRKLNAANGSSSTGGYFSSELDALQQVSERALIFCPVKLLSLGITPDQYQDDAARSQLLSDSYPDPTLPYSERQHRQEITNAVKQYSAAIATLEILEKASAGPATDAITPKDYDLLVVQLAESDRRIASLNRAIGLSNRKGATVPIPVPRKVPIRYRL